MITCFAKEPVDNVIPIYVIQVDQYKKWKQDQSEQIKNWLDIRQFKGDNGRFCVIPDRNGSLKRVILTLKTFDDVWFAKGLPQELPDGQYRWVLENGPFESADMLPLLALAWGLGSYQFTRYRQCDPLRAQLVLPNTLDQAFLEESVRSFNLVRDLINTPAADMTPGHLAEAVLAETKAFRAKAKVISGEKLLKENFPAVYAVGKGSIHEPHLIDVRWGDKNHPKVTLVGKGISFDSGGLDIKTAAGMLLMKKDMGGAAHALGLARLIMARQLPVQLRLLIPTAENAVSGSSYHPGDVLATRNGMSVEVTNTDAEGRLVLCDALAAAVEEKPDILFDFATLTGAARVALGPNISALFSNNNDLAQGIEKAATQVSDPVWHLPLYSPYRDYLNSNIADLANASKIPYGGAITAGLFLQTFVPDETPWAHFDISAWNMAPTRPNECEEADVMAIRAVFAYLEGRYT